MENQFDAGPNAKIVVDESECKRWESVGVTDHEAQDKIFQAIANAVAELTADSEN